MGGGRPAFWTLGGDILPGMRFPAPPATYPTRDQMADFLETYASTFELPVRTGVRVRRLAQENGEYPGEHRRAVLPV